MTKAKTTWQVRPHGDLVRLDDGILSVVGTIRMPLMELPRRMTEAHVPTPVRRMLVKDREALRLQLGRWAEIETLRRIVVSHGDVIEDDPRATLRELAASLA